jgi:hypothetical protein
MQHSLRFVIMAKSASDGQLFSFSLPSFPHTRHRQNRAQKRTLKSKKTGGPGRPSCHSEITASPDAQSGSS